MRPFLWGIEGRVGSEAQLCAEDFALARIHVKRFACAAFEGGTEE